MSKGSKVYIEGRIKTRQWDDQNGNKRYTTEIFAREMKMLDSKRVDKEFEEDPYSIENATFLKDFSLMQNGTYFN